MIEYTRTLGATAPEKRLHINLTRITKATFYAN